MFFFKSALLYSNKGKYISNFFVILLEYKKSINLHVEIKKAILRISLCGEYDNYFGILILFE